MAVSCPADGCEFQGTLDQVEGHLGGVADTIHDGMVESDLGESLHGEGYEDLPWGLIGGLVLAGIAIWWLLRSSGSDEDEQDGTSGEASSGVSTVEEVAGSA